MKPFLFLSAFSAAFLFPLLTSAQTPLVICRRGLNDCDFCDLIATGNRVVQFITILAFSVVVIFIAWNAILMIMSGGDESKYKSAKKSIFTAVIGLLIILVSWVFVTELLSVLSGEGATPTPWNQIECRLPSVSTSASTSGGGASTGGFYSYSPSPPGSTCADDRQLANFYNVSYPFIESSEITQIKRCVITNAPVGLLDLGQVYTIEQTNPKCNLTRGTAVCGIISCQHSINSCHYGGVSGTQGLAVDFNAASGHSEQELNQVIKSLASTCGFSASDVINEGNHTHISAPSCSN